MVDLRKVSKKQFLHGMNLALQNARSLAKEAELLAKNKAYSRAFALGVLSLEEAGKVVFLTMCFHGDRFKEEQKIVNRLWKLYSSHQAKIDFFEDFCRTKWKQVLYVRKPKHDNETTDDYNMTRPLEKAMVDVARYIGKVKLSSFAQLKLKCLYVDIDEKTLNFQPPLQVPYRIVKGLILLAKNHIRDAEKLRDTFRRAKTDQISDDIMALMFKREILKELSETVNKW